MNNYKERYNELLKLIILWDMKILFLSAKNYAIIEIKFIFNTKIFLQDNFQVIY